MSTDHLSAKSAEQTAAGKKEAVVLVNTLAPRANAFRWAEVCAEPLGPDVSVREVRVTGFAAVRQAAEEAANAGVWLIIVVGGDGTLNSVINGIGDKPTRIAVLPAGTSNDMAYNLGQSNDLAENIAALGRLEPFECDLMRINGERFALIGMFGYGADVAITSNDMRSGGPMIRFLLKLFGNAMYTAVIFWLLFRTSTMGGSVVVRYRDLSDNSMKTVEADVIVLNIFGANTLIRGDLKFAPTADIADGKIDLWMYKRSPVSKVLNYLGALGKGTAQSLPEVIWLQSDHFEIEWNRPMQYIIDGDPVPGNDTAKTKYTIDLNPVPLRLLAPKLPRRGTRKS